MTENLDNQRMEDFNRGVVEGMKHQQPSPTTLLELNELKAEWAQLKTRALNILIAGVVIVGGYGIWVGNIQTGMTQLARNIDSNSEENVKFDARLGALEVNNGEIKTKLIDIEATLQEIKLSIGRIR